MPIPESKIPQVFDHSTDKHRGCGNGSGKIPHRQRIIQGPIKSVF
jgi:hypothetical protein